MNDITRITSGLIPYNSQNSLATEHNHWGEFWQGLGCWSTFCKVRYWGSSVVSPPGILTSSSPPIIGGVLKPDVHIFPSCWLLGWPEPPSCIGSTLLCYSSVRFMNTFTSLAVSTNTESPCTLSRGPGSPSVLGSRIAHG